jgi:hypothetical protein
LTIAPDFVEEETADRGPASGHREREIENDSTV